MAILPSPKPTEPNALPILIRDRPAMLFPTRGLYLPEAETLLVADTHLGKSAGFRGSGIAAPDTTHEDLARLDQLINVSGARRLVILGDFYHSRAGVSGSMLEHLHLWRQRNSRMDVVLVRGNHDRGAGDPPGSLGILCAGDRWDLDERISCHHEPVKLPGRYVLSGHLHPGVILRGRTGPSVRAACFAIGTEYAVLPAFGSFTGLAEVHAAPGTRLFAILGDVVWQVPTPGPGEGGEA